MGFRIEEKLLVEPTQLSTLNRWLHDEGAVLLHPRRRIFSTYLDTPAFDIFKASEEGSVPRKKIRVRTYNADNHFENDNTLEIKISSVEGRFKTSEDLSQGEVSKLLSQGYFDDMYGNCLPAVSVAYDREYFQIFGVRLTIDTDIHYLAKGSNFPIRDFSIAVEIKAAHDASQDALAEAFPMQRTRFSKYARAINATRKGAAEWL